MTAVEAQQHRRFFALLLAPLALAGCAEADPSAVAFVRSVYETEIAAFAARQHPSASDFESLLSEDTQKLMRLSRSGPGPKYDGPLLHALFGWGVLPGASVRLSGVAPARGFLNAGKVEVRLRVNGEDRMIAVTVSESCDAGSATVRYCIDDFHYGTGLSYRQYIKQIAGVN